MTIPNQENAGDEGRPNFQHLHDLTGHTKTVASVKFKPKTGEQIATASADKTARIWDAQTGQQLLTLEGHSQGISDVCWSPQGNYICTASDDHTLKLWDVETGKSLKTLTGHTNYVFCCSFDPQSHLLVRLGSLAATLMQ